MADLSGSASSGGGWEQRGGRRQASLARKLGQELSNVAWDELDALQGAWSKAKRYRARLQLFLGIQVRNLTYENWTFIAFEGNRPQLVLGGNSGYNAFIALARRDVSTFVTYVLNRGPGAAHASKPTLFGTKILYDYKDTVAALDGLVAIQQFVAGTNRSSELQDIKRQLSAAGQTQEDFARVHGRLVSSLKNEMSKYPGEDLSHANIEEVMTEAARLIASDPELRQAFDRDARHKIYASLIRFLEAYSMWADGAL